MNDELCQMIANLRFMLEKAGIIVTDELLTDTWVFGLVLPGGTPVSIVVNKTP